MASLHLCSPATNFNQTDRTVSTSLASSFTSSYEFERSNVRSCRLKLLSQKHRNIVSQCDRSAEGSTSLSPITHQSPLKIGIIGLDAFAQFLAKAFQKQGHSVVATSRSDYSEYCKEHGIEFFKDLNCMCEAQPDILLVCSSILSTEKVIRGIPFHKLKPDTIIADVLSVKQFPKNLLAEIVPSEFGILCTHPIFDEFSGKNSWEGLRFVYEKVRISHNTVQEKQCEEFLDIFQDEGCKMVEMSCEEHDRYAAESQFVTHTMSRILSSMNLEATPIDNKGYEALRGLTQGTLSPAGSDIYDDLFLYNVNSTKQIQKLETAFDEVKKNLLAKLRESFNRQMEEAVTREVPVAPIQTVKFLPSSEKVLKNISSFAMIGS